MSDLRADEAAEMGVVLCHATAVVGTLTNASQVYVCLWSHGPAHIHFVVQPETDALVNAFGTWGPALQAAMFERGDIPERAEVERFATRAREAFKTASS